jgi:hypothetical protein
MLTAYVYTRPRKGGAYTAAPNASGEEAVKKFGNAKSISSDMFFGNENQVSIPYRYPYCKYF